MKRVFLILILTPSIAFGTYTEFYCQNGGSNLNAGSTTNNTATYTSASGNWAQATKVFTPTDGVNPSLTVSVGDFASVYVNGSTVSGFIGRITAVQNATNGTITVNGTFCGAAPANQTGTATIKVGGAWLGPNAASGFPFTLTSYGNQRDTTSHAARCNLKNDQTYSVTASFSMNTSGAPAVMQGYSSSVGDGGKATYDGGTSTGTIMSATGPGGNIFADLVFKTSISSGTTDLVTSGQVSNWIRCVFTGSRNNGLNATITGVTAIECEAYNNNTANTASKAGFVSNGATFLRCVSHDNTGSNSAGFLVIAGPTYIQNCIADTNGGIGISITANSVNGLISVQNCDIYNNGSDGINIASGAANPVWIENTNFIKNTGAGINNVSVIISGFAYNGGYGAGTQANGSSDTINNLTKTGTVTYGSNLTPWVDPANGDFRINLPAAYNAGRGSFTETAASYSGTVGYQDIGAANHNDSCGGTGPCQTSGASAH